MNTKIFTLLLNRSLLSKLALIALLLTGGGNCAWAQKSLPYSYGFEGVTSSNSGLSIEGWTLVDCYNSSYSTSYTGTAPYALSSGKYAGDNAFRFYPNSSYAVQYLISPELASSATGLDVTFHYKSTSSTTPVQTFYVGYSSTNAETTSFTWGDEISYKATSWETYNNTFPAGTKYIAIKYTNATTGAYLYLDGFEFASNNPYKVPTDFSLASFTEASATFSWTAGKDESAWQLAYSTSSDFTPGTDGTTLDITENPYTLTGLTTGTTYYAAIRANYGSGNYSEWTDKISFIPSDEVELVINNTGTTTNNYVPINGSSIKSSLIRSQFIIPSTQLSAACGRQITKLICYSSTSSTNYQNWNFGSATFEIYLKEIGSTSFSSTTVSDWGVKVYSGTLNVSDYKMEIALNTPYNYNGGNLQVSVKQVTKASETKYFSWVVVNGISNSARYSVDDDAGTLVNKNPMLSIVTVSVTTAPVQIDDNGYTTFASTYPLDFTAANMPSGLKAYKAMVDGTNVRFTEIDQTVPANTGVLLGGMPGETYQIPVADSGTAVEGNEFLVNSTGGTFAAESGYTYYALKKNSDPLTFATFDPTTLQLPTNKAYLKVSNTAARSLTCWFDNETTGISSMSNEQSAFNSSTSTGIYNLQGQRVAQPQKGLYIMNGKKFINK